MLKIIHSCSDIDISELLCIYEETVNSKVTPMDFLDNLTISFRDHNGAVCLWKNDDALVSAVICESYQDGCLLYNLETKPDCRRKGYATMLMKGVLEFLIDSGVKNIYSHIHKRNKASIMLHKRLGFSEFKDYAKLLDGTVSKNYTTFVYHIDENDMAE